jgi:pimeloyl-ACP methyl ester carboxylesterase
MSDSSSRLGPLARYNGERVAGPQWFENAIATPCESHVIDVAGARIHYLRWGDRTRPGLLLVHGNGAHSYWWSFIAPFLAREYNVAALDLSGMGQSEHRARYTMEHFVAEEMAVATHAGMFENTEPPVFVAHSFGGFATILAGAQHGDRLAGTVIVDSPVNPPDRPGGPPRRESRPHRVYPTLAEALARFRLAPEQPCENDFIVDFIARKSLRAVEGGFTWKFDPSLWSHHFSIGDTAACLRSTRCRIAIMRGEDSVLMPPEVGAYMYSLLGHAAPVIDIPHAQHHVMLDQPLAFVAALRALLADWNHSQPMRRV